MESEKKDFSISFVCHGNICRSPMAELIFRRMLKNNSLEHIRVTSVGLHAKPRKTSPPQAVEAMAEIGLDLTKHRARPVLPSTEFKHDLIIPMDRTNLRELTMLFPQAKDKTLLLRTFDSEAKKCDIADPYGGHVDDYRSCRHIITESLLGLIKFLKSIL